MIALDKVSTDNFSCKYFTDREVLMAYNIKNYKLDLYEGDDIYCSLFCDYIIITPDQIEVYVTFLRGDRHILYRYKNYRIFDYENKKNVLFRYVDVKGKSHKFYSFHSYWYCGSYEEFFTPLAIMKNGLIGFIQCSYEREVAVVIPPLHYNAREYFNKLFVGRVDDCVDVYCSGRVVFRYEMDKEKSVEFLSVGCSEEICYLLNSVLENKTRVLKLLIMKREVIEEIEPFINMINFFYNDATFDCKLYEVDYLANYEDFIVRDLTGETFVFNTRNGFSQIKEYKANETVNVLNFFRNLRDDGMRKYLIL